VLACRVMLLLLTKTVHILAVVVFLGTGGGSAWYKFRADRSGDIRVIAWAQREIVFADWVFTIPSAVMAPLTGILLVELYHFSYSITFIYMGILGYMVAGMCWLPAAWAQLKMRALADKALEEGTELPPLYHRYNRLWLMLGFPSFSAAMFTVWVMVAKPTF